MAPAVVQHFCSDLASSTAFRHHNRTGFHQASVLTRLICCDCCVQKAMGLPISGKEEV